MKTRLMIVAALGLLPSLALAHPVPKIADPKPNAILTASPTEIRIGFSEGFVPAFSGMEVDDASGKAVVTGTANADPGDDKVMILPVSVKLASGTYTVKWHAVGDDTHHVGGHYSFQVK